MTQSPGAVVVGGYINGLGLVRSLAARGVATAVVATQAYDIAQHSRYATDKVAALDADTDPQSLVELLLDKATDWSGRTLFPSTDPALAAISAEAERLSAHYRLVAPPPQAVAVLLDKDRMLAAAQAVGIAVPHCYGAAQAANSQLASVRFPVVIKPLLGYPFSRRFGVKLFTADTPEELAACLAKVAQAGLECRVFDRIPGRDDQIFAYCLYVDRQGQPSAGLTVRKLRQSPPFFGVARVSEIALDPASLRDQTIALLQSIGFRGMAAAEFKLDPRDGTYRFMEVNGRSVIYNGLLRRAGLDMAGMAWSDHGLGSVEPAKPNGWKGVWINLLADVGYSIVNRRSDPIGPGEIFAPYRRPIEEAAWSMRDPAPFLAQWAGAIGPKA